MTDKGPELNERVWKLFALAGFETKPNSHDPSEEQVELVPGKVRSLDLSASITSLGIKVIGENKGLSSLQSSFTQLVHDMEALMQATKANAGLFVLPNIKISDEDRHYAAQKSISVWDEAQLRYYEVVAEAEGDYAKYEIINSLGITTDEEKDIYHVLAIKLQQPFRGSVAELFMFTMPPERLLKTCAIYRRARGDADAYQRMLRKKRLRAVRKFVSQDNALLPTNIIVHLSDKVNWYPVPTPEAAANGKAITLSARKGDYEIGMLSIPMEYASLELIDGQHRLYGFVEAEATIRQNFNLVVLGLKGLSDEFKRETFVAINDNSRRVDANLVAYLKYTSEETECQKDHELMAIKVVVELSRKTPFDGKIRLLDIGSQRITLKGFSGYDLKSLLSPRGLLRKYHGPSSKEYVRVLRLYFGILKSMFPQEWNDPDTYIIFTNRGISAFLKLLKSILRTQGGPVDEATIKTYLNALKNNWAGGWEKRNLRSAYVGSRGWKDFHRDLVKAIRQSHPDFRE